MSSRLTLLGLSNVLLPSPTMMASLPCLPAELQEKALTYGSVDFDQFLDRFRVSYAGYHRTSRGGEMVVTEVEVQMFKHHETCSEMLDFCDRKPNVDVHDQAPHRARGQLATGKVRMGLIFGTYLHES